MDVSLFFLTLYCLEAHGPKLIFHSAMHFRIKLFFRAQTVEVYVFASLFYDVVLVFLCVVV